MAHALVPVDVTVIAAGKLRRYHGVSVWRQLLDVPTVLKNVRDIGFIAAGFFQSLMLLISHRPDVIFAKGGYVCLPLGYVAKLLRIPLVIHDSDTKPGMTNSVLSRFATKIATGAPLDNYSYPVERSVYTGVPIDPQFHPYQEQEKYDAKQALGMVDLDTPLIVVTGGSLGAKSINNGVISIADKLLEAGYAVYHVTGKKNFDDAKKRAPIHANYQLTPFVYKDMATVLGAADLVITRASATTLQELAALAKPTIIVPAHQLGDQVKNALVYESAHAAYVLDDDTVRDETKLFATIMQVFKDTKTTAAMTQRFHEFAKSDAAIDVAKLIVEAALPHDSRAL